MQIRKLTEQDYASFLELNKELDELHVEARPDFFVHRDDVFPKEAFDANLANPESLMLGVFDKEETMIGFVRATLWNKSGMVTSMKMACLDDIYVVPAHRRSGIARKLFAEVEQWARELGAVRLELLTWDFNKGAIATYCAMGMTPQRYIFEKKL